MLRILEHPQDVILCDRSIYYSDNIFIIFLFSSDRFSFEMQIRGDFQCFVPHAKVTSSCLPVWFHASIGSFQTSLEMLNLRSCITKLLIRISLTCLTSFCICYPDNGEFERCIIDGYSTHAGMGSLLFFGHPHVRPHFRRVTQNVLHFLSVFILIHIKEIEFFAKLT